MRLQINLNEDKTEITTPIERHFGSKNYDGKLKMEYRTKELSAWKDSSIEEQNKKTRISIVNNVSSFPIWQHFHNTLIMRDHETNTGAMIWTTSLYITFTTKTFKTGCVYCSQRRFPYIFPNVFKSHWEFSIFPKFLSLFATAWHPQTGALKSFEKNRKRSKSQKVRDSDFSGKCAGIVKTLLTGVCHENLRFFFEFEQFNSWLFLHDIQYSIHAD